MEMETVNIPLGAAGSLRSLVCGRPGVALFPLVMLYPSDAFELVSAPLPCGHQPQRSLPGRAEQDQVLLRSRRK